MRLAVAGLGFMGATHLKALEKLPGATLAAVVSSDEQKLAATEFASIARYRDLDSVLADASIDAVDLCIPTYLHESTVIRALERGKHVLVEKPMAFNGAACDRMLEAAHRNRRTLMVAHVLRFHPAYQALVGVIRDPALGQIRRVTFRRRVGRPSRSPWMSDPAKSGGGILDLLIHDADIALELFGTPDHVTATGHSNLALAIDVISAELFYANGMLVEIQGGWHHASGFPFSMEYTVVADGGTVAYDLNSPPAWYPPQGESKLLPVSTNDAYAAEIAYFLECAQNGKEPVECRPQSSAAAVRLVEAMLAARERNGERVSC